MNYKERLSLNYSGLTPTDKIITTAVIKQPELFLTHTIQQVTDKINVSPAAMIRYVKKLGYRGFKEFILALEAQEETADATKEVSESDTLFTKVLETYMASLERSRKRAYDSDLRQVANLILDTPQVKAIGIGNSGLPAEQLVYSLYTQGLFIEAVTSQTQIYYLKEVLDASYLLIIYTVSGIDDYYREIIENANRVGAKTVVITLNPESQAAELATIELILPNGQAQISENGSLYQVDNRILFFVLSESIAYYVKNELDQRRAK
ncbi:MurR/RpiR family transcriptional regulator [Pseudolactococcus reticulitermitis]|uniref:HTH rpiR-type domain-containing protein n=1 Tax=Pseudolactococcus reticulitermitis TaxID=2025039 RepID=A0A224X8V1_9LACT|nr:MurR/RpiR family transcriptional regulator [Lactococcus reticulitermitis]GAX46442.1 hypothetical protein RsY01_21 [Lactococcus reticulitermitis]